MRFGTHKDIIRVWIQRNRHVRDQRPWRGGPNGKSGFFAVFKDVQSFLLQFLGLYGK